MKLSKTFTTVTPFSKMVALIFLIMLPFVGFSLGVLYQQEVSLNNPAPTQVKICPIVTKPTPSPAVVRKAR